MKVSRLTEIIKTETEKGNLKEDFDVVFTAFLESEFGPVDFEVNDYCISHGVLYLSDSNESIECVRE